MLMAVKNQLRVTFLATKYALMREMLNRATFIMNIFFMVLNNASFIIQWIVLYTLKDNIGGYTFKEVLLLWGIAASTYGMAHFLFKRAFDLSNTINSGKLDAFIIQPKNVLINAITNDVTTSALGDMLFGYIMFFVYGFSIKVFILFTFFVISGGLLITAIAVILGSIAFWISNSETIADKGNDLMVHFATYPDGIFKGIAKLILFTIIPVGIANYIPVKLIINFNFKLLLLDILVVILFIAISFVIFYKGLKKYSSSNLMSARI